jgi:arsenate reductase
MAVKDPANQPPHRKRVLFLCTGNSCRSQMAEAIVNAQAGERWQAFSAGSRPAGFVHPATVRVLAEIGIDASHARSKPIADFKSEPFDLVVTVCDQAAEDCPVWLGSGERVYLEFPDPARVQGDEPQVMAAFRSVRDAIQREILALLAGPAGGRV